MVSMFFLVNVVLGPLLVSGHAKNKSIEGHESSQRNTDNFRASNLFCVFCCFVR